MRQILFRIPLWPGLGLPIYGYGMMLFLAFLICNWMAGRRAQKEGIARERIQDLAIWLFLGGLVGARTTYLLEVDHPASLLEFLQKFPRIWDGGIILYGAVIGGLAGYALAWWFILRKHGLSSWKVADIIAPACAVGLCLGRVGCLLNGCCYGHVAPPGYPALHFPFSAPPRSTLVPAGLETAAGFTLTNREDEDLRTVTAVAPGSGAEHAGLRPGDVIVAADDQRIQQEITVDYHGADGRKDLERARFEDLGSCRRFVDSLRRKHPEGMMEVYDSLEDYLDRNWPRGKNDLALTVRREGQEVALPAYELPWTLGLHPTQVYESISMALLFLLLTAFYPFRRREGQVIALLMIGYGMHRFLNERLRDDPRPVGFEAYISLLLIGGGLILLVWLWRAGRGLPPPPAQ